MKLLKKIMFFVTVIVMTAFVISCKDHVHDYELEKHDPTCTEQGYTIFTCECGDSYIDNYIDALGHNYQNSTSNNDGTHTNTCSYDNSHKETVNCAFGNWVVITEATAFTEGKEARECSYCGFKEERVIPATHEHEYANDFTVDKEATCLEDGLKSKHCLKDNCNDVIEETVIPALGHTIVVDEAKEATCTAAGLTEGTHCSVCNEVLKAQEIIEALGHSYEATVTAPTCTEDGYTTHTCSVCSDTYKDGYVEATGHSVVVDEKKEATCTIAGLTEGSHCSVCNEVLKAQEIIEALGHKLIQHESKEATCTERGWKEYVACSTCEYSTCIILEALGHDYDLDVCVKCSTVMEELGYIFREGSYYVSSIGNVTSSNIIIPNTYKGYQVVGVENYAFSNCLSIRNVFISEGVNIGSGSFRDCKNLTSVFLSEEVVSIGDDAFGGCDSLSNIFISSTIKKIGRSAFGLCYNLKDIYYNGTIEDWCNITFSSYDSNPMYYANNFYMLDENDDYYNVKDIIIPNTITNLGKYTFYGFKNLTTILIPENVTSIGNSAFYGCVNLTSISLPISITNIEGSAFSNCVSLESIILPDNLSNISYRVFENCSSLKNIVLPESITNIGYSAFENCINLISITLPKNIENIETSAFYNCYKLTIVYNFSSLNIQKGDSFFGYVGYYAHNIYNSYEEDIIDVTLDGFVIIKDKKTGNYCLDSYKGNQEIVIIPEYVNIISDKAFYNCQFLIGIVIPENVIDIGILAFYGCEKLYEVYNLSSLCISKGSTDHGYIGYYAVNIYDSYTSKSLKITNDGLIIVYDNEREEYYLESYIGNPEVVLVPEYVDVINDNAFYNCNTIISIIIPEGVTRIGDSAFANCINLESAVLPSKISSLGSFVFSNCTSLESVNIPEGAKNIGYSFSGCTSLESIILPSTLSDMPGAFQDCIKLKNIIIPEGIISIDNSFRNCTSLFSVTLPSTLINIGGCAFYDCASLINVIIPESVTSIGDNAFSNCSSLTSITLPDSVTSIEYGAFSGCTSLKNITLPERITTIENTTFYGCTSLTNITLPESVTSIGESAFFNCTSLISIKLPEGVTSIGDSAFRNCTSLTSITLPEGVTSIGKSAFYNCRSLTNIKISEGVTDIGQFAFYNCRSLANITIPKGVTNIEDYTFNNCRSLVRITIPEKVISIGSHAFSDCRNLTSITIPKSVTNIGYNAFSGCFKLYEVYNFSEIDIVKGASTNGFIGKFAIYIYNDHMESSLEITDDGLIIEKNSDGYCLISYTGRPTNIIVPDYVTNIGNDAFSGCRSLISIVIPNSVTSIGYSAFSSCANLSEVYNLSKLDIRKGDTDHGYIGYNALNVYNKYTNNTLKITDDGLVIVREEATDDYYLCGYEGNPINIIVPDYVTSFRDFVFSDCSSLQTIIIPEGVKNISWGLFYQCVNLESVTIPGTISHMEGNSFYNCNKLKNVFYEGTIEDWCNIIFDSDNSNPMYYAKSFYMLDENGEYYLVKDITIPETITTINLYVFYNCDNLEKVYYNGTIEDWCNITFSSYDSNPMYYAKAFYMLDENGEYYLVKDITIPEGVTTINPYTFYCFNNLKKVTIPASVTTISNDTFRGCYNLEEVIIEEGSNLTTIGNYAFYACAKLKEITLPNTITSIGTYAFEYCYDLDKVYYDGCSDEFAEVTVGSNNTVLLEKLECLYENPVELMQVPYLETETYSIVRYFFDSSAEDEILEKAIIIYNGSYNMSQGVSYSLDGETSFNVHSAMSGTVTTVSSSDIYGITVIVDHGNGVVTEYSALSEANVSTGDVINQGDLIGISGCTVYDAEAKNHVHFKVSINGEYYNPLNAIGKSIVDLTSVSE